MQDDDVQLTSVSNDQQTMPELAEDTGGFAVANSNQIEEPTQRMMEDIRPQADGSIPMLVQLSPDTGQFDIRITAQQGRLVAESTRSLEIE